MADTLEKMFHGKDKAEFLEWIEKHLEEGSKVVVCIVTDMDNGYKSATMTLNVSRLYEALGVIESAANDIRTNEERYLMEGE